MMEIFYREDARRLKSGEADYGVHWRDGSTQRYRVSYIQDTGEVYAVGEYPPVEPVRVLGIVPPDDDDGRALTYYRTLDAMLEGWPEQCGVNPDGLGWVARRIGIAYRPPEARPFG